MEHLDTVIALAVIVLAGAWIARSWITSLRRAARGESSCSSCPGGCSGKSDQRLGSPLGDLRGQG